MENIDFVAIDFENADSDQYACSVGVVVVKNREIAHTKSWLIRPPENRYGKWQIQVHGITPEHTLNSPEFPSIYQELRELIEGKTVVAHSCKTDRAILSKTCTYYNLPQIRPKEWVCTYELLGAKLDVCCKAYGIDLNHHEAASDAAGCAQLYICHLNGQSFPIEHVPARAPKKPERVKPARQLSGEILEAPNLDLVENKSTVFFGKRVIITGETFVEREDLAGDLKEIGADIQTVISKKTDFVIIGNRPGPAKMEKVKLLQDAGAPIKVITELEVLNILSATC